MKPEKYILQYDQTEILFTLKMEKFNHFTLQALDKNLFERWTGHFDEDFIEQMTLTAGSIKTYDVFIKMIRAALSQSSNEVEVLLISPKKLQQLKPKSKKNVIINSEECKVFIIREKTSLEEINFPLILNSDPLSETELTGLILSISRKNEEIRESLNPSHQEEEINNLEAQITNLQEILENLQANNTPKSTTPAPSRNKSLSNRKDKSTQFGKIKTSSKGISHSLTQPRKPKKEDSFLSFYQKDKEQLEQITKQIRNLRILLRDSFPYSDVN